MHNRIKRIIQTHFLSQSRRQAYYSEASVQLKIAFEIYKQLRIQPRLEHKLSDQSEYLDIFFKRNNRKYAIELKYKTVKVAGFAYTTQAAQNNAKYDFLKDLERLERFRRANRIHSGFCVFVTNDSRYWNPARQRSKVKKFDLTNNTTLHGTYSPRWKGRSRRINLTGTYNVQWLERPTGNSSASFHACIISVHGQA